MFQNPCKTLGFKKNMVYEIPPGGGEVNHIQPVVYVHLLTNQYLNDNLPKMQIRINIGLLSFSYHIFREGNLQHLCNRTCVINHCRQDTLTIHLLISKPFTVYLPTCSKF